MPAYDKTITSNPDQPQNGSPEQTPLNQERYAVLLVDDSADDRMLLQRALRDQVAFNVIGEVRDGEEAICYLSGQTKFGDRNQFPFPDVMLLDLKMPRKTGYDVLLWLQTQSFSELTVIVVSGSLLPEDKERSLSLGAHGYHRKPVLREDQDEMFREIEVLLKNSGR